MCHTQYNLFYIIGRGSIQDGIKCSDGSFSAFKTEPFLTYIFCVEEFFKQFRFMQATEDASKRWLAQAKSFLSLLLP